MEVSRIADVSALTGAHFLGSILHGFDDVLITGAAAEVPGKRAADFGFLRILISLKQIDGRQNHSGSAIAALQPMFFPEAFLHGMQRAVSDSTGYVISQAIARSIAGPVARALLRTGQPFDRGNL